MSADIIPILFLLLLAAGVFWILWRVIRRVGRPPAGRQEPPIRPHPELGGGPPEPAVQVAPRPPSTIPDAADVLALKAAIDNLARQIAALEKRLASGDVPLQGPRPAPAVRTSERTPAPSEPPPIVPDGRF